MRKFRVILGIVLAACCAAAAPADNNKKNKKESSRYGLGSAAFVREFNSLKTACGSYNAALERAIKTAPKQAPQKLRQGTAQSASLVMQQCALLRDMIDDRIGDYTRRLQIQQNYMDNAKRRRQKKNSERTESAIAEITKVLNDLKKSRRDIQQIKTAVDRRQTVDCTDIGPAPSAPPPKK